jgi:hypothetical protein
MLLVCIIVHLKSVLSYKFLILDDQYLREQGCEETKRGPQAKKFGEH